MGVPEFLPGSKLERQSLGVNTVADTSSNKKIFRHKPKTMKQKGMVAPIQAKSGNDY